MVSSPSQESKSARSGKPDHFQENLGSEVRGVKEGTVGDSVLQVSDLPNRIIGNKTRSMSMGAVCELGRYNSQPQQQPSPGKQVTAGVFLEANDKIDVFELQGVPGMNPRSDTLAGTNARDEHVLEGIETTAEAGGAPAQVPSSICLIPAVQVTDDERETCTPGRLMNSDEEGALPGDTLEHRDDVSETDHVDDVMLEFREAVTALPPSFAVFLQDVKRSPGALSDNSDELHKSSSGKDSPGDWSDGGHRRMERVVPVETWRNTPEFENDEYTDLAPLPFSGPISALGYSANFSGPISAAPGYSGPIHSNAGSISRRSDSCNTSTRSFAFPILPGYECYTSPARMPPPDRSWKKKSSWRSYFCCSQPSTHP